MNTLDIILLVLFVLAGLGGAKKGFLEDISQKFGYVTGFIVAIMFTRILSEAFNKNFAMSPWLSCFCSYVLLFVAGYLIMKIAGSLLKDACESGITAFINSFLGFILKVLEMMVIAGAIIQLLSHQNIVDMSEFFTSSAINRNLLEPLFKVLTSIGKK